MTVSPAVGGTAEGAPPSQAGIGVLLRNVAYNFGGAAATTISAVVVLPVLARHLGKAEFGAWALITALFSYAFLLDLGVGLATMRSVAEHRRAEDRGALQGLVTNAFGLYTVLGVLVLVAAVVVAPFLDRVFALHGVSPSDFRIAFLLTVGTLGLTFPSAVLTACNQGLGDYGFQNVVVAFQTLSVALGCILVAVLGGGIVPLAAVYAAGTVAALLAKLAHMVRRQHLRPGFRGVRWRSVRSLLGVSAPLFIANVIDSLIFNTDNLILGAVLGTLAVATYSVALGPARAVLQIGDQFNSVSLSSAAAGSEEDLATILRHSTRLVAMLVLPPLVVFAGWGHQLLDVWVGSRFDNAATTLWVLTAGMGATCVQGTASQIAIARHRQRPLIVVTAIEAAINIGLSIYLARQIGVLGVAIGTTVPTCATAFLFSVPYASRLSGIPVRSVYARLLGPAVVAAVVLAGLLTVVHRVVFPGVVVFALAAAGVIMLCIALTVAIDRSDRRAVVGVVRRRSRPGSAA